VKHSFNSLVVVDVVVGVVVVVDVVAVVVVLIEVLANFHRRAKLTFDI
jgi:hypothetical protein